MGVAGREAEIGVRLGRDSCYQAMFARAPFLKMAAASTLPTWRARWRASSARLCPRPLENRYAFSRPMLL
jgi:hypothetical protein